MRLTEVAGLLGYSKEQASELIASGLTLPISKVTITLETTQIGNEPDVSDEQFDNFVAKFDAEEPGRWPPAAVRRELLIEARHSCAICRSPAPIQFHHLLDWAKIKHHDTKHMLALCGTCHSRCTNGQIDFKAQYQYKAELKVAGIPHQTDEHLATKRSSDLKTLRELYAVFPRPVVEWVLNEASVDRIHIGHLDVLDTVQEIAASTLFHLYDGNLHKRLKDFFHHWEMSWEFGRYSHSPKLSTGIATLCLSDFDSPDYWEHHKQYLEHLAQARRAHTALNRHIRETYPEFDLDESDQVSVPKYWEFDERIRKQCEAMWNRSEKRASQRTLKKKSSAGVKVRNRSSSAKSEDKNLKQI